MSNLVSAPIALDSDTVAATLHGEDSADVARLAVIPARRCGKLLANEMARMLNDPAARVARTRAAIVWLRGRGILVDVVDRKDPLRRYRFAGQQQTVFADTVLATAQRMGWEG